MTTRIVHLHRAAPPKPAPHAPCNGCGVCCAIELCPLAILRFRRRQGPCPALQWSDAAGRYQCGMLLAPERFVPFLPAVLVPVVRRLAARWIAAGVGCDCNAEIAG